MFHGLNAYREGDDVVLVVSRLDEAFVPGGDVITDSPTRLHRWRIGTGGDRVHVPGTRPSRDIQMDLPTHDRRHTGRAVRHGWFTTTSDDGPWGFEFSGILPPRPAHGPGPALGTRAARRAGEAFFVPAGRGEGEGWLLTYTYDRTVDRSHLDVARRGGTWLPARSPASTSRSGSPTASTASGSPTRRPPDLEIGALGGGMDPGAPRQFRFGWAGWRGWLAGQTISVAPGVPSAMRQEVSVLTVEVGWSVAATMRKSARHSSGLMSQRT